MSSFTDILGNSLLSAAPSIIGNIVGTNEQNDANAAAAQQQQAGAFAAADILGQGYDQSWDAQNAALGNVAGDNTNLYNTITPLISAIPTNLTNALTGAASSYGSGLSDAAAAAKAIYDPASAALTSSLASGANSYGTDLGAGANGYAAGMGSLADSIYSPYSTAGRQALSVLQGVMGSQASTLTPAQLQARADYLHDAQMGLDVSGLRGAGRAGIASLDKGLATLDAQNIAANQARIDQATQTVLNAGEAGANQQMTAGSAGQGALLSAGQQAALQRLNAINSAANNQNAVAQKEGDQALAAQSGGAGALLSAQTAGANAGSTAAQNLINATQSYLQQKAGTDLAQGQLDTNNIMGKANAAAGAAQGAGVTNAAVTAANGANWGGALGTLGGVISADNKAQLMPSSFQSTQPSSPFVPSSYNPTTTQLA